MWRSSRWALALRPHLGLQGVDLVQLSEDGGFVVLVEHGTRDCRLVTERAEARWLKMFLSVPVSVVWSWGTRLAGCCRLDAELDVRLYIGEFLTKRFIAACLSASRMELLKYRLMFSVCQRRQRFAQLTSKISRVARPLRRLCGTICVAVHHRTARVLVSKDCCQLSPQHRAQSPWSWYIWLSAVIQSVGYLSQHLHSIAGKGEVGAAKKAEGIELMAQRALRNGKLGRVGAVETVDTVDTKNATLEQRHVAVLVVSVVRWTKSRDLRDLMPRSATMEEVGELDALLAHIL